MVEFFLFKEFCDTSTNDHQSSSKVLPMSHYCSCKVGPDEVDEELHDEIQQECGKYGKVENVVIYQVSP